MSFAQAVKIKINGFAAVCSRYPDFNHLHSLVVYVTSFQGSMKCCTAQNLLFDDMSDEIRVSGAYKNVFFAYHVRWSRRFGRVMRRTLLGGAKTVRFRPIRETWLVSRNCNGGDVFKNVKHSVSCDFRKPFQGDFNVRVF